MTDSQIAEQLRIEVYQSKDNNLLRIYNINKSKGEIKFDINNTDELKICIINYLHLNIFYMKLVFDKDAFVINDNSYDHNILNNFNNQLIQSLAVSQDIINSQNYKYSSQKQAFEAEKKCSSFFIFLVSLQIFIIIGLTFYQVYSLNRYLNIKRII